MIVFHFTAAGVQNDVRSIYDVHVNRKSIVHHGMGWMEYQYNGYEYKYKYDGI